jgi:hypothetical protein
MHQLRSAATTARSPLRISDRLVKERLFICSRHVPNEDPQDPAGVGQHYVGVNLQVSLAAVPNQNELAFREVTQELLKRASFPLSGRFEDSLQHARVSFEMERTRRQSDKFKVFLQQRI